MLVVAVSHVSPIKAAVCWALGVDERATWRMFLDLASVTRIGCRDGEPPSLVEFNETPARCRRGNAQSAAVTGIDRRAGSDVRARGVDDEAALAGPVGDRHPERFEQRVVVFGRRGRSS